jgi:L-histidine N-alpha-methyltransferase
MPSPRAGQQLEMIETTSREHSSLEADVRSGLSRPFKELPPKHLYDARGCELFDEICTLEEYYPTRTEHAILTASAETIVASTGAGELIELGAGSATKTRVLLDAMRDAGQLQRYVPFDIAMAAVEPTAQAILAEYPSLPSVRGVVGDFLTDLELIPEADSDAPRIVALLGSTIGNFIGAEREQLLSGIAALLRPQDFFLMGTDLVKDPAILEAAYNDSRGVTAAFNLNLLTVINRDLGGDIPVDNFRHVARFETDLEWIEMRLVATEACRAHIDAIDLDVSFDAGEEMRTEISAKFTPERIALNLDAAGLEPVTRYTDADDLFALTLARPVATAA